ncbi:MAG: hypothetical protein WBX15_12775 [Thermoanaerobaculia bacterium]
MTRLEAWYLHFTFAVTAATGVVFAWMKYFMKTDDPFAVANHPAQPYMLDVHVVFAPLLLFGLGVILHDHILFKRQLPLKQRRRSGLAAFWSIAPMVLSGYLLQVGTAEWLRSSMAVLHWITGGAFLAAYAVHQLSRKRPKRAA